MVSKILKFGKQKGSSLALPANGLGGSRATYLLVAHFALQNTASNSAEKKNRPREGVAEFIPHFVSGLRQTKTEIFSLHFYFFAPHFLFSGFARFFLVRICGVPILLACHININLW